MPRYDGAKHTLEGWGRMRPLNILDELRADRADPVLDDRYWAAFDRAVQTGLIDRYGAARIDRMIRARLGRPAAPSAPVMAEVDDVEADGLLDVQPLPSGGGVRSFDLTDFYGVGV